MHAFLRDIGVLPLALAPRPQPTIQPQPQPQSALGSRMDALPESTLRHILLTATPSEDLLCHVARCSLVCREWSRIARASAAYGSQLAAGPLKNPSKHRADVLSEIRGSLLEAAGPEGTGVLRFYERLVWGDEGGRVLGACLNALPGPLRLTSINLSEPRCCGLTAAGMAPITVALHRCFSPGLKALNISGNLQGWRASASPISQAVSSNPLGDAGLTALSNALPETLELLKIGDTCCGDAGMSAIARALPQLTQLQHMCCSDNPDIGKAGWAALAVVLPSLPRLKSLSASGNGGLDDVAAEALAVALPDGIETLYLYNCSIGDGGACALAAALPRCTLLTHLLLAGNRIGAKGIGELSRSDIDRVSFHAHISSIFARFG